MSRPGKCNGRISEHRIIKIQPFLGSLKTVKEPFKGQAEKHHLRRKYLSSPLSKSFLFTFWVWMKGLNLIREKPSSQFLLQ